MRKTYSSTIVTLWLLQFASLFQQVLAKSLEVKDDGRVVDSLFGTDPLVALRHQDDNTSRRALGRRMKNTPKKSSDTGSFHRRTLSHPFVALSEEGKGKGKGMGKGKGKGTKVKLSKTKSTKFYKVKKSKSDKYSQSKNGNKNRSRRSKTPEDDPVMAVNDDSETLMGDFSSATAESPIIETSFSVREEGSIPLELSLPPNVDVYLVNEGNSEATRRVLQDLTALVCPPPNGVMIDLGDAEDGGTITLLIPADVDSEVLICSEDGEVIGAYFHDVVGPVLPTSAPKPSSPAPTVVENGDTGTLEPTLSSSETPIPNDTPTTLSFPNTPAPTLSISNTPAPTSSPTTSAPTLDFNETAIATPEPTPLPTPVPTPQPSGFFGNVTDSPSASPSAGPSAGPTSSPSADPNAELSIEPTIGPSALETEGPSTDSNTTLSDSLGSTTGSTTRSIPSSTPSLNPSEAPVETPSTTPSSTPSSSPSTSPSTLATKSPVASVPTSSSSPTMDDSKLSSGNVLHSIVTPSPAPAPVSFSHGPVTLAIPEIQAAETLDVSLSPTDSLYPGYYEPLLWVALPANIQDAAGVLGYNQTSWDGNLPTNTSTKFWSQLTMEEQTAAAELLYNSTSWNDDIMPTVTCKVVETWSWVQVPQELVWALEALGYNAESWDTADSTLWPRAAFQTWSQLSDTERKGAKALGYTRHSWENDCS